MKLAALDIGAAPRIAWRYSYFSDRTENLPIFALTSPDKKLELCLYSLDNIYATTSPRHIQSSYNLTGCQIIARLG